MRSVIESSDLLSRIKVVESTALEVERSIKDGDDSRLGQLAYAVDYLAKILRKHLETGER